MKKNLVVRVARSLWQSIAMLFLGASFAVSANSALPDELAEAEAFALGYQAY